MSWRSRKERPNSLLGGEEGGLDQVGKLEIGLQRRVVEVILLLAQLFGVIAPVPGRQVEIAAFARDQRLQRIAFLQRALARRRPRPLPAGRAPWPACPAMVSASLKAAKFS